MCAPRYISASLNVLLIFFIFDKNRAWHINIYISKILPIIIFLNGKLLPIIAHCCLTVRGEGVRTQTNLNLYREGVSTV